MSDDDVLIKVEHVSKKFCRSLKRSLWYGAQDVANSLMPWNRSTSFEDSSDTNEFPTPPLRKDEFWAVRDISFEVRRGECLGLIGHNGAGKSTLLKMLNSLNRPDCGRITLRGKIGALIELSAGFNPILTGRENIYNQAALLGFSKKEADARFEEIVAFADLGDFLDSPVKNYSSGMAVRLGFATVTLLQMDILLIDEVLAVGDMGFVLKCLNRIGEILPKTAVIFVSHSMPMVARICNQVVVLESGRAKLHTSKVAEGIQSYLAGWTGLVSKDLGNGAVSLIEVLLSQESSKELTEVSQEAPFKNGNSLLIKMRFRSQFKVEEQTFVCIKVFDQQLRECLNSFSFDESRQYYEIPDDSFTIQVQIPSLYLNGGLHYLSIALEGADTGKLYCFVSNIRTFMVNSNIQGWATSVLPGEWDFYPGEEADSSN